MKPISIPTTTLFHPVLLIVSAEVRYWEDATVNGVEDEDGSRIPCRDGKLWRPNIVLENGRVLNWPEGTIASVHYKVCDAGEYWLEDADGKRVKWKDHYVPNSLLCIGARGYGDYIILNINADGLIQGWDNEPAINGEDWECGE